MNDAQKIPFAMHENLEKKLEELVKKDILSKVAQPTDSVSDMMIVQKSNGDLRICLDPVHLNKNFKRLHNMLPKLEHIHIQNAKVLTLIEPRNGFWQDKLDENSRKLTTFATPFERFCWNRLPVGIVSAPKEYQRRIQKIL